VVVQPDEDLNAVERCVESVLRERYGLDLEVVLVDATGSPAAHSRLEAHFQADPRVRLLWIDHDPGAAGARNLGLRASRGTYVALLDPSVELMGETWPHLIALLADPGVGGVGPFGLVTADMRHFYEAQEDRAPIEVDALQNYLMVLRRADVGRIGPLDEHFRFYRILDLDLSYALRARIGRLLNVGDVPVVRHRHALWESLSEGDREERSRKNFGRFLKRWDHRHDLARHGDAAELATTHAAVHG
jgi:cysteinyl-tRNA synthetase